MTRDLPSVQLEEWTPCNFSRQVKAGNPAAPFTYAALNFFLHHSVRFLSNMWNTAFHYATAYIQFYKQWNAFTLTLVCNLSKFLVQSIDISIGFWDFPSKGAPNEIF